MKKHLAWFLPLAGILAISVAAYVVLWAGLISELGDISKGLLLLGTMVAWFVVSIIFLEKTVRNGYRTFRAFRRAGGHLNKAEQAQADLQRIYEKSWTSARDLVAQLGRGEQPLALAVWGIVLEPGETVRLSVTADYARFYGGAGNYVHTSGFFWGRPAFVLAGYGVTALANRSRRRAAETASRQQWRDIQRTQMFLTDRRVICQANGRWLSFHYSHLSACYPEPENNSIVLEFPSTEPLMIGGPEAPPAIAYIVWAVYGERGLADHPAMRSLHG